MNKSKKHSPEVRERGVRIVFENAPEYPSRGAAIQSIAEKIDCSGKTLRNWVRPAEGNQGKRAGLSPDEPAPPKELERENRELKCINEILRKVSACLAQAEFDRRPR